jgi:hypothetical protein
MADSLVFKLEPRGEALTFRALIESTESINRILRDVDYGLTGEKTARQWLVTKLSNPTPTLTLEPMLDEVGLVDATAHGIEVITGDDAPLAPPKGWTDFALDDLRKMKRLFNGHYGMRQVTVSRGGEPVGRIADDIQGKVDRVYRGEYSLLGSLEGTLEAVNLHGHAPFTTIWERVSGRPVRVYLPKGIKGRAKELLESRVLAIGRVKYFANGTPRAIVDLTEIRKLDGTHRVIAEYGSIPDLTGDQTTEEFLRAMRE